MGDKKDGRKQMRSLQTNGRGGPNRGVVKQKKEEKWGSMEVKRKDEGSQTRGKSIVGGMCEMRTGGKPPGKEAK